MKRILIVMALIGLLGCASSPEPIGEDDLCRKLNSKAPKVTVTHDLMEENQYMYLKGAELAVKMKQSPGNNVCVVAHLHMMHRNLTSVGLICTDVREDMTYLCETSCDSRGGEVVKVRINKCYPLGGE